MIKHICAFFLIFALYSCAGKPATREPVPGDLVQEEAFQDDEADSPAIAEQEAEAIPEIPETVTSPVPPPEKKIPIALIEPEMAAADREKTAPQAAETEPPNLPEPVLRLVQENAQPQAETVAAIPPASATPPPVMQNPPPPAPVAPPPVTQNQPPPPTPVAPPPVTQNQPPPVMQNPPPPPAPVAPPPVTQNPPAPAPVTPPSVTRNQPPLQPAATGAAVQDAPLKSEQAPATAESEEQANGDDEEIFYSRIVRATVGQLVEIPFRGSGWVYLGELGSQRGIEYRSRRLDPEGQSFIFQIEAAGTYTLKFYKQDFIRNYILNDHVQVIAGLAPDPGSAGWFNPPLDRGRVIAEPRWPTSLEEAELVRNGGRLPVRETPAETPPPETAAPVTPAASAEPAKPATVPQEAAPTPQPPANAGEPAQAASPAPAAPSANAEAVVPPSPPTTGLGPTTPPNMFLQKAQEEFDAGKVASALAILDQFIGYYPSGSDEAYWLYGQFYEANSPSRNILLSLDYYRRLTQEYPQSSRYNDARRRIAYLERFYINIQ